MKKSSDQNTGGNPSDAQELGADPDGHATTSAVEPATPACSHWSDLRQAKYSRDATSALARLSRANVAIALEQIIDCLAAPECGLRRVELCYLHRECGDQIGIGKDRFLDCVAQARLRNRPIDPILSKLANDPPNRLFVLLGEMDDWYLLRYGTMRRMYERALAAKQVHGRQQQSFARLRSEYASVLVGDKSVIVDKVQSIRSGRLARCSFQDIKHSRDGAAWWKDPGEHDSFVGVTFAPGEQQRTSGGLFNLYPELPIKPTLGDASPINDYVRRVWCSDDADIFARLTTRLAHIFQFPAAPPGLPVLFCGGDELAVTFPFRYGLGPMLGSMYRNASLADRIGGGKNAYAASKLVVFFVTYPPALRLPTS